MRTGAQAAHLPTATTTPGTAGPDAAFPTGIWHTVASSQVGYRVNEVLFGQNNVAVGRTHSITGAFTIAGTKVTQADFTVQMSTVHSDESQRDNQFDGRIMDVTDFPTVKPGATMKATATGTLTLRGQTHLVSFDGHGHVHRHHHRGAGCHSGHLRHLGHPQSWLRRHHHR